MASLRRRTDLPRLCMDTAGAEMARGKQPEVNPAQQGGGGGLGRPGISREMLARAGVRWVGAEEAEGLCGLAEGGLWLPYKTLDSADVSEGGKPYGRLRLDRPQGSKKYHQAFGTGVHAYLPPGLIALPSGEDLVLVEGEFKTL